MPRKKKGTKPSKTSKSEINLRGTYSEASVNNPQNIMSFGASQTPGLYKTAGTGSSDTQMTSSLFYSPELTTESWLLPKSRQEILKWARIFYNLEPYVQRITNMHASYPFSKFEISTDDETITEFYKDMAFNADFDLSDFIDHASLSYHKFGEAIPFGNMVKGDDGLYRWKNFVLLEPELVEIKQDLFEGEAQFELVPSDELKNLVKSNKDDDIQRLERLKEEAPEAYAAIKEGRNIQLSNEHVSIIANKTDPSATRGTSPIQCLFKVLIYQDWIRLAQSAFAQRYVFPIELWKIGDPSKDIYPKKEDLDDFRSTINQAVQNPPFTLVYPPIVQYEAISTLGKQFPINKEYEYIHDQLLVGMGVNKNIILGEGPSFSNVKTMSLHVLMNMYKEIRDKFENWIINKFFRPIAIKNNFYTTHGGKKVPILPTISWNKSLDIEEEETEKKTFVDFHQKGIISTKTLFDKFPNIDFEEERKRLEEERGTIFDKGNERLPGTVNKPTGGPGGGGGGGAPGDVNVSIGDDDIPGMPDMPDMPEGGEGGEGDTTIDVGDIDSLEVNETTEPPGGE